MNPTPTIIPAKRRVRRKRTPPATTAPPAALAVLGVEAVTFGEDDGQVTVVFNTTAGAPINGVGTADPVKWTARFDDKAFEGAALEKLAFNKVRVSFGVVGPDPGADVINYSNAPSDIADAIGRQLAAFSGLPL